MRILFLHIKSSTQLAHDEMLDNYDEALLRNFPGSVIYGPGYEYETNDTLEILEKYGGEDKFDAIACYLPERAYLGEPFGENIIGHYSIPPSLWRFPHNLGKSRLPKIMVMGDFWHLTPAEWGQVFHEHRFGYVLSAFLYPFSSQEVFHHFMPLEVREKTVFVPFPSLCKPFSPELYDQTKLYDVVMTGAQVPSFYPVRARMFQAFAESGINLHIPRHPGYNFARKDGKPVKHPYVQSLFSSRISAFCATRFHFPPAKLLEAMFCGAAAMCDYMHGVELLGFKPDEHFILADGDTCVEKARLYLQEPGRLREMCDKAYKVAIERHTVETRVREMAEILPSLLNGGKLLHWAEWSPNAGLVRAHNRMASRLQPVEATEEKHYDDFGLQVRKSTWDFWYRLASMHTLDSEAQEKSRLPALLPARQLLLGHLDLFKAEFLVRLAEERKVRHIVETGAKAGFFSMVLAQWLLDNGIDGRVLAMDETGHQKPKCYYTSLFLERAISREALWDGLPAAAKAGFVQDKGAGGQDEMPETVDLLFLNRGDRVYADYTSLKPRLHEKTVIVINGYGPGRLDIMNAARRIAREAGLRLEYVSFEPGQEGLAVLGSGSV